MTEKYTPEKVAELVAESRVKHCSDCDHFISAMGTALTAVSAERDEAEDGLFRAVQALGFDTDGATDARGFFGPQTYHAGGKTYTTAPDIAVAYASEHRAEMEAEADRIEAARDRLHKAITEARKLNDRAQRDPDTWEDMERILRAALDKEGNDDE